jgi:hypothetical protein
MTREEYFASPEISRSLLKTLNDDPRKVLDQIKYGSSVSGKAIDIGNALDCHMFDGDEEFRKQFFVMEMENPFPDKSVNAGKFMYECIQLIQSDDTANLEHKHVFEIAYERTGMKRPNLNDMIDQFIGNGGELYLEQLVAAKGKTILTPEDYELHLKMKYALEKSGRFGYLFDMPYLQGNPIECQYQLVHIWDNKKIMLDIVEIDHHHKMIYGKDLKTTSENPNSAEFSILKYGYHLQAGMYHDGLIDWANINYPDYTVSDTFDFIFVQKCKEPIPFGLRIEGNDLAMCKEGGKVRGRHIKGYKQLEEELKFHMETGQWDLPKDFYNSDRIRTIQLFDNADTGS